MKLGWLRVMGLWFKRHWFLTLIIAGLLCAGGWWFTTGRQGEKKDIPPVKADNRVLSEGIVFPVHYAQMVMPVEGTIGEILVQEGDSVQAGQSIIRLVRQDYQARVGSTKADISRAAAAVEQARVNLADAERELERQQRLVAVGATSKQQCDQARTAVERNRAALAQTQAELETQQARLVEAEGLLDKTELKAAISGTVAFLDIKVGEHAAAGTVLVRIADESAWEIRSDDLTELTIAKVKKGDPAALTFDGIPDLEIPGRVKAIRAYGEKKRGDITYTVTVVPERWDERLRWNMTAQLAITPSGI
ncbi:Colistin resistance protein EmrA [Sporomusa acidovorans DSM 3132]|uniref:Colistin resistance protein EmrA n=2 Tax=Sporomusa TaxID=2375 RepID=A0ABZ3J802_SPOA4|nr:efflux RND transporter periplasmic adaptor subunit [Sporomusa acidovorans]OZC16740.1 macrolide export protein MacA [Sporomusa acidovorans DSM 3132]SDE04112.1 HlyD family secretion protein [Sporomusa acidovorans]